jgi:uncharacterized protein (DUF983 family)
MPHGNDCPACGEDIGVWAVFKAPLPNRIYCPHCGERLRYGGTGPLTVAYVVLTVGFVAAGVGSALAVGFDQPLLAMAVALGVLVLGGLLVEAVFVCVLWYGDYRLEPVNRTADEWEDF